MWPTILPQSLNYTSYLKKSQGERGWASEFTNLPSGKYGMNIARAPEGGGLGVLHKGEEVIEAPEVRAIGNALNNAQMEKTMMERGRGSMYDQPPTIIDASTHSNVTNTLIRPPSPGGQLMYKERADFV